MNIEETSIYLAEATSKSKSLFLYTDPEVLDFTNNSGGKVIICTPSAKIEIPLFANIGYLRSVIGVLHTYIFNKEITLFSWDIKSFVSYFSFYLNKPINFECKLLDLCIVENFLGMNSGLPKNMTEMIKRFKNIIQCNWKFHYETIHKPLIYILSELERQPVLDIVSRHRRYAHYEIEGQANGRLRSSKKFEWNFNPHRISKEEKDAYKPRGYNKIYIYADFKNCEVSMLQWLSNDQILKKIINSKEDVYSSIYKIIANESDAKKCKSTFLPILYGCGAKTLAKVLEINEDSASQIINRTKSNFSVAYNWIIQHQRISQNKGVVVDYFGKSRSFGEKHYLARDFVIQSPTATFCFEKLIDLYNLENKHYTLAMSIHDGYVMICDKEDFEIVAREVKEILESESKLCPGLKMKVGLKAGQTLALQRKEKFEVD